MAFSIYNPISENNWGSMENAYLEGKKKNNAVILTFALTFYSLTESMKPVISCFLLSIHPLTPASLDLGRSPDLPIPSHLLQLFRWNTDVFPGHPRDIIYPARPGSWSRASFRLDMPGGGILTRCLNILNCLLSMWIPPRYPYFQERETSFRLLLSMISFF